MNFPTLPISDISRKTIKPAIRASFDGGYEQSRPKFTRRVKEFSLTINKLTIENAIILDDFFIANQGLDFYFYDEVYDTTHTVRFSEDELNIKQVTKKYHSVSLTLKEV